LNDGMVLVVGATSSDLYDPTTGTFTKAGDFAKSHDEQFTATLLNDGRVLVTGGGTRGRYIAPDSLSHVDIYDPSTGKWSSAADMTTKRWGHTATVLKDGSVLVMNYKSAELYNPDTNTWTVAGDLPRQHGDAPGGKSHTATLLGDGRVFIVGGGDVNYTKTGLADSREGMTEIDVYDPAIGW
ncbi:MAG: kelch repeat-containing protein, partial [Chloroflexi bacterium]|nr:kelch repeat-containing protein [Chloroflexota bacterium]